MKKFLAIIAITFLVASCNTTKKTETKTSSWETTKVETNSWKTENPKKEEEKKEEKVEDKKEEPVKKQEWPQVMLKKVIIIGDKNCKVCEEIKNTPEQIAQWLKTNAIFKNVDIKTYDVSDKQAQKIMEENELTWVPVILADTNEVIKGQKDPTLRKTKAWLYAAPGALYDYKLKKYLEEVGSLCTNKKDDDGDGKIDCKETSCLQTNPQACKAEIEKLQKEALKKRQEAMEKKLAWIKSDRPKVDLYVMSYCPFGTQAEKPFLGIMKKFKDVADIDVKFVQYVMHTSQGEWEENLLQYCIKTTQKEKFVPYLECFLQAGDSKWCLKKAKIDEAKVNSCIAETDKKFKIKEKLADKTQRFPEFPIDKETALKAWVQGSPTLVINWLKIDGVDRTEKGFAEIICKTFKTQPAICKDLSKFSTKSYKPGFGFDNTQSSWASAASCGTN